MTDLVKELKLKIIRKEGHEAALIKCSAVAKILGYSNSTPIVLKALEVGITPVKVGNTYKIKKADLERLLFALICRN